MAAAGTGVCRRRPPGRADDLAGRPKIRGFGTGLRFFCFVGRLVGINRLDSAFCGRH